MRMSASYVALPVFNKLNTDSREGLLHFTFPYKNVVFLKRLETDLWAEGYQLDAIDNLTTRWH